MFDRLIQANYLYHCEIIQEIENMFGQEYVYENNNGGFSINHKVLVEFRILSRNLIVWNASEKYWRLKETTEPTNQRII